MRTLKFSFLLLVGLWVICLESISNNTSQYYFRTLDINQESPMRAVSSILQDRQGFLWFGGMLNGLRRYDGLSYKYFNQESGNLNTNFVTTLYEDADGKIWIGTDAGVYIYFPLTESIARFLVKSDLGTIIENPVTRIIDDGKGVIWISVDSQGLFRYDPESGTMKNYFFNGTKQTIPHNITRFLFAPNSILWIALYADNLYYSDDHYDTLTPFISNEGTQPFKGEVISKILPGPDNRLYVGTSKGGLKEVNLVDKSIRDLIVKDDRGQNIYVREITYYSEDELWIGTESGIFIYTLSTGRIVQLQSHDGDPYSLSDNAIYCLYKDREGVMWVGSYFGGINYYPRQYTYFEKVYPQVGIRNMGKRIREFCESNDGTVWFGTEDAGLYNYDPRNGNVVPFNHPSVYRNVHGLYRDGDYLWVGTFSKGLNRIDLKTNQVKNYMEGTAPNTLNANDIFTLNRSSEGGIWIGTTFGLMHYNYATDDFTRISELDGVFIYDLMEDSYGNLWLATFVNGIYKRDAKTGKWDQFTNQEDDPHSIPSNKILSIFEDSRGQIWFTTQSGGFCRFDPVDQHFICYDSRKGLPSNTVYQIIEDHSGYFWITTNNGLVKFDPRTDALDIFTQADGLLSDQFNYQSAYKDRTGTIYVGSINGFMIFNPANFVQNTFIPPVVITEFRLFGEDVKIGSGHSPLKKSITLSKELVLKSTQNSFSFRIASLSYQAPRKNKLFYKLEGYDTDWQKVDQSPLVTYSNLPYGTYLFKVKGSNSDGLWNEDTRMLTIHILPPFYLSWWAYCIYTLLIGVSIWMMIRYFKRRNTLRNRRQMEKFEQKKERELYTAKIDFFTNVTHEIRTPLTLIKAPLENILNKKSVDSEVREDLLIMDRNTNRLLQLVNQLLDFRKTEKQGFKLSFVTYDISSLLQSIYQRFTPFARQKNVELTLQLPEEKVMAAVDSEGLTKIISNLLTNAVKYAHTYIQLSLSVDKENNTMQISVSNDGSIVPVEMREEIFKPFVQYKDQSDKTVGGTGIGLSLARSLAELHQGSLRMDDSLECNKFIVTLPLTQTETLTFASEEKDPQPSVATSESISESEEKFNLPTLLLVEDDPEMSDYIARQLSRKYTVHTAGDGIMGLEVLEKHMVDLIISDVMMPRMDGIEFCQKIKADLSYSHIPVILLTAKTHLQSKIEGLNSGADAYIEKPFSVEYLEARISNLLSNRAKIRAAFLNSPFTTSGSVAMTKADEKFLKSLNEIVVQQMQNPDFCLDDVAYLMHMSRSSLNRKIKGILDLTPNDYIRLERLKKAAILLKEENCRVNEVCYRVGFNTPSYFTKCFQKQFGVLPKDFAASS